MPTSARREIEEKGVYLRPSRYDDGPYPITAQADRGRPAPSHRQRALRPRPTRAHPARAAGPGRAVGAHARPGGAPLRRPDAGGGGARRRAPTVAPRGHRPAARHRRRDGRWDPFGSARNARLTAAAPPKPTEARGQQGARNGLRRERMICLSVFFRPRRRPRAGVNLLRRNSLPFWLASENAMLAPRCCHVSIIRRQSNRTGFHRPDPCWLGVRRAILAAVQSLVRSAAARHRAHAADWHTNPKA